MEAFLTIEQAATRLQMHKDTIRKQLKRGQLRGVKRGRVWRVPESALGEAQALGVATVPVGAPIAQTTPQERAAAIQAELRSGDAKRRNAAIIQLTRSNAATIEIVTEAAARAVETWDGPEDDLSAWRNVDLKPHFPEEAPDYLEGLYRDTDEQARLEPEAEAA